MSDRPTVGISDYANTSNAIKRRLYDRVRTWADLVLLDPEHDHPGLAEMDLDLYHMACWSRPALVDLRRAEEAGIPTVNSYEGAALTEDRLAKVRRLEDDGVHLPAWEFGTPADVSLRPPVVVKPRHELEPGGHEFSVVFSGPLEYEGERLVQRYIVPRRSYKVFGVGEHVRTTRHLTGSGVEPAALVPVRETTTLSRTIGLAEGVAALFGLSLFEIDLVVHKAVYVIDVNPVVSLDGVGDAVEIYDRLLRRALERS